MRLQRGVKSVAPCFGTPHRCMSVCQRWIICGSRVTIPPETRFRLFVARIVRWNGQLSFLSLCPVHFSLLKRRPQAQPPSLQQNRHEFPRYRRQRRQQSASGVCPPSPAARVFAPTAVCNAKIGAACFVTSTVASASVAAWSAPKSAPNHAMQSVSMKQSDGKNIPFHSALSVSGR